MTETDNNKNSSPQTQLRVPKYKTNYPQDNFKDIVENDLIGNPLINLKKNDNKIHKVTNPKLN